MRTISAVIVTSVFVLLAAESARSEIRYLAQAGANTGLLAGGVMTSTERFHYHLSLGLTPSFSGDDVISQVNGEVLMQVSSNESYEISFGPALLLNASSRTFFTLPGRYPDGYYPPNAYFFAAQLAVTGSSGYFVKASIIEYYLQVLARNPRGSVTNAALVSLGFGRLF